ncbi:hypothetical protein MMC25_005451 [Agyrium rufum]|nr:hypothetical protein [Agyrium rufum]
MDSVDGVETLTLEVCYYITAGNLRIAWLTLRRALAVAEILDLSQETEVVQSRGAAMWFRLTLGDLFLSLLLGLPSAAANGSFDLLTDLENTATETPIEKLDRDHASILAQIVTRNTRMQYRCSRDKKEAGTANIDLLDEDFNATQAIGDKVKLSMWSLPAEWWMPPLLIEADTEVDLLQRTATIVAQMHHYFLLLVTYQPYLIENVIMAHEVRAESGFTKHPYSEAVAVSASRQVLSHFFEVRRFHRSLSYRALDDKVFPAVVTLLLAQISGHHLPHSNVLDHQRPQDLSLLKDVVNCIESNAKPYGDQLSESIVRVLKKLVQIEADAARGLEYSIRLECSVVKRPQSDPEDQDSHLYLPIPYIGTMCISRQAGNGQQCRSTTFSDSLSFSVSPQMCPAEPSHKITFNLTTETDTIDDDSVHQASGFCPLDDVEFDRILSSHLRTDEHLSHNPTFAYPDQPEREIASFFQSYNHNGTGGEYFESWTNQDDILNDGLVETTDLDNVLLNTMPD